MDKDLDPTLPLRERFDRIERDLAGLHVNTDTLLVVFLALRRILVGLGATEDDIREAVTDARAQYDEVTAQDQLFMQKPTGRRDH